MPSAPRNSGSGARRGSTLFRPWPLESAYSCTPIKPLTKSPAAKFGLFDSVTWPTAMARITPPSGTGGMYESSLAFIQPRIAGSSEMWLILTCTSPSAGARSGSPMYSKSLRWMAPCGRRARRNWWLVTVMAFSLKRS